MFMHVLIN